VRRNADFVSTDARALAHSDERRGHKCADDHADDARAERRRRVG
jgi:hypothetical protein